MTFLWLSITSQGRVHWSRIMREFELLGRLADREDSELHIDLGIVTTKGTEVVSRTQDDAIDHLAKLRRHVDVAERSHEDVRIIHPRVQTSSESI